MPSSLSACKRLAALGLAAAFPCLVSGQAGLVPQEGEYPVSGPRPGEQTFPGLSINPGGGYVVWQDNGMDGIGKGLGIGALRLDAALTPSGAPFRVNQILPGDQEKPQVAMLNNGGAAFVWQGGLPGFQNIYARFTGANGAFVTPQDVLVGSGPLLIPLPYTTNWATIRNNRVTWRSFRVPRSIKAVREFSVNPVVAALADGNAVVAYSSRRKFTTNDQTLVLQTQWTGSIILSNTLLTASVTSVDFMQDVYVQRFTPAGVKLGAELRVNQHAAFNQHHAAVAALHNGNFVVAWVSELQRGENRVDIFARIFDASGAALTDEFLVNTADRICASPAVSGLPDGGFTAAWSQKDAARDNGLDIYARVFNAGGQAASDAFRVNSSTYGDQYAPSIVTLPAGQLFTWNSRGNQAGIFGCMVKDGAVNGGQFQVNSTASARLLSPVAASDGVGHALVIWSAYVPGSSIDLFGQRYVNP
jgi:hypothetical protein